MGDDPRKNLKWLEQELLAEEDAFRFGKTPAPVEVIEEDDLLERVDSFLVEDDDLLEQVDRLLAEEEEWEEDGAEDYEEEQPVRNFANNYGRQARAQRIQQAHMPKFDESAALPVKSGRQLRKEAKKQKIAEKKASVNRSLKGLTVLAVLEICGILAIIGWWLQWLI